MVVSWLVSGVTFVVAVVVIIVMAKVLCNKEKKPSELERETRTCMFPLSAHFHSQAFKLESPMRCVCVTKVRAVLLSAGVDNTYVALSINKL